MPIFVGTFDFSPNFWLSCANGVWTSPRRSGSGISASGGRRLATKVQSHRWREPISRPRVFPARKCPQPWASCLNSMVPRRERSHPSARRFDASSPLVTQGPMECPRWKLLCRQEPDRCRLTQYSMMAECRQSTQHLLKVECRSSSSTDGLSGISDGQGQRPFSSSSYRSRYRLQIRWFLLISKKRTRIRRK